MTLKNQGNYKLTVDIQDNFQDPMLDGYYIDVYETAEDGTRTLKESGLYFTKEQAKNGEVFIGGRYEMPGYAKGEDGTLVPDGTTTEIGYTPAAPMMWMSVQEERMWMLRRAKRPFTAAAGRQVRRPC